MNKINQLFSEKIALRILSLCMAVYVLLFFSWCCLKYYGFAYDDFDLAIHDQIIWNILHGRIFNSILGVDFLGNHVHFISFLVAPLYGVIPHPLFLLFLQTVFLAAGVFPLYALARLYLGYELSLIIGIIYLLYPGLGYTNLYEFHPTCFATFFLLCTAYCFYKENFLLFNVFMVLSLLCQENISLIFIMWGIYACILKRKMKWVLWPTCLGVGYFLLCVYIILPGFNKNTFNFFQIYGPLGSSLSQVIQSCVSHPVHAIAFMFQPFKIHYLVQLFISTVFVPLLSPLALLPASLIFIQHLLSTRYSEVSLHFHYTAELIPFIFVAFVFGVKKITGGLSKTKYLGYILLLNAFVVIFALGPYFYLKQEWNHIISDNRAVQKEKLIKQIPEGAPVVATFEFLPHLSHRQNLYSFHHVYSGYYTLFTKPYRLPDNVQYALIDFYDFRTFFGFYRPGNYRHIDDFLKQGAWGSVDVQDNIVLFKKGTKNKYPLFNFINHRVMAPHPVNLIVDNRMNLLGYDVSVQPDCVHLIFYWNLLKSEQKDINLFVDFVDQNSNIIDRQLRPLCYRIWPTQAWGSGQVIEEHQYISIPPKLRGRLKDLDIKFFEFNTRKIIPTDSKEILGRIKIKLP